MKYGISGYRDYKNYEKFSEILKRDFPDITVLILGDCRGVDKMAKKFAIENNITYIEHKAQWKLHKLSAGPIRNKKIADDCEQLIAFYHKKSKGTRNCIGLAMQQQKPVHIYSI